MLAARVSVQSLVDGRVLRLDADSPCVPFPLIGDGPGAEVLSVEPSFEDLRCVSYSTNNGPGGYVASEASLGSRSPGEVVIVRAVFDGRRDRWLLVKILMEGRSAESRATGR